MRVKEAVKPAVDRFPPAFSTFLWLFRQAGAVAAPTIGEHRE
jgi:hypothetical protein